MVSGFRAAWKSCVMKHGYFFYGSIAILIITAFFIIKLDPVELLEDSSLNSIIHPYLEKQLQLPPDFIPQDPIQLRNKPHILYIMGGDEASLLARFRRAAQMFHAGMAERIWVYIQPGITAFDQTLDRNLTNREWALRQFALLDIAEKDIVFLDVKEGFWGTLSEAESVFEQAGRQGVTHIDVVTSTYHTRRVRLTFSRFSEEFKISFTVYAADDVSYLRYLLKEYGKLLVYKYILLPLNVFRITS